MKKIFTLFIFIVILSPGIWIVSAKLDINLNSDKQQNIWYNTDISGQFIIDATTTHNWIETSSSCVTYGSCGNGSIISRFDCRGTDGLFTSDSFCSGSKPSTWYQSCAIACPVDGACGTTNNTCTSGYAYNISKWGWNCSGSGGGSSTSCNTSINIWKKWICGTSINTCDYGWMYDAPDSSINYLWVCGYGNGSNVSCALPKSPWGSPVSYSWKTWNWSECWVRCGAGKRTRSVSCQDNKGNPAKLNKCKSYNKPSEEKACSKLCCAPKVVRWVNAAATSLPETPVWESTRYSSSANEFKYYPANNPLTIQADCGMDGVWKNIYWQGSWYNPSNWCPESCTTWSCADSKAKYKCAHH